MSGTTVVICPCDADTPALPTNPPGLPSIAYRVGTFRDFRRALLTPPSPPPGAPPVEQALIAWRADVHTDPSVADLAVMIVEWWAYLADILTFYNERIANEDYLRTVQLPESAGRLVSILGYRPRPALGATGTLAALITPGQSPTLPTGLQFQSKPAPGQEPQTFELSTATTIGAPDVVPAVPPPVLIAIQSVIDYSGNPYVSRYIPRGRQLPFAEQIFHAQPHAPSHPVITYQILLQGNVTTVSAGALLALGPRDDTVAATLITLNAAPTVQTVSGGKQTVLDFTAVGELPSVTAATARLQRAAQNIAPWTVNGSAVSVGPPMVVQLAGLARQIRANDWVTFTAPGVTPQLVQIASSTDVLGDISAGSGASATSVSTGGHDAQGNPLPTPIPVLHTALTLQTTLPSGSGTILDVLTSNPAAVSVLFGWIEVGTLLDQPPQPWDGTAPTLDAVQPGVFPAGANVPIILQDANAVGIMAVASTGDGSAIAVGWPTTTQLPLSPPLQPPLQAFYNLLPVTRGKTIANEVLGSGDATVAGQSFALQQSPVTYLAQGADYASTIRLTVNGVRWTEVKSFYGQAANAQVFVTREDDQGSTHVDFGDGVNGARLPTGTNNVVATYRIGAGAASPPAGKLTVIAQAYPGLRAVQNPVAVNGGSDPDPRGLLKQYAPRSVLTFGRAVSIDDYQALAAQASGVTRASAVWSWDSASQRAGVTVYVAGTGDVVTAANTVLMAAGDPNRPVTVLPAQSIAVSLVLTLIVSPGMDTDVITTAATAALADPATGLFAPANRGIAQPVFDSEIEAVCLGVAGVVALTVSTFYVGANVDLGPLHAPGEGAFYLLTADGVFPSTQADPNG